MLTESSKCGRILGSFGKPTGDSIGVRFVALVAVKQEIWKSHLARAGDGGEARRQGVRGRSETSFLVSGSNEV